MEVDISACMEKVAEARDWMFPRLGQPYPWDGLTTLPLRQDGTPYNGTNIPLLWMQQVALGSTSPVWGSLKSWSQSGKRVSGGSMPQTAVYFSIVDVNVRNDGTSDKNPFDLAVALITQRHRVLKPIVLYNEAQTEEYVNVAPSLPARSDVRKLLEPFFPFCTQYLEKWKAHPENRKKPISAQEEVFVTRFAADILVIGANLLHAHEIPKPYPGHALDAIDHADGGRVMKLAGIAQELAGRFQKTLQAAAKSNLDSFSSARSKVIVTTKPTRPIPVATIPEATTTPPMHLQATDSSLSLDW